MKVLKLNHFCLTDQGDLGIAKEGAFASTAWIVSNESFHSIRGNKFSWIAPNGGEYMDDKSIFSRPTETQVIEKISPRLKEIALEAGLIKI